MPSDYFVAYQQELKGLPEVQFDLQNEGDDVWLRIPRLPEISAPEPDSRKPLIPVARVHVSFGHGGDIALSSALARPNLRFRKGEVMNRSLSYRHSCSKFVTDLVA